MQIINRPFRTLSILSPPASLIWTVAHSREWKSTTSQIMTYWVIWPCHSSFQFNSKPNIFGQFMFTNLIYHALWSQSNRMAHANRDRCIITINNHSVIKFKLNWTRVRYSQWWRVIVLQCGNGACFYLSTRSIACSFFFFYFCGENVFFNNRILHKVSFLLKW